ncbi:hypothetical protein ACFO1B_56815 [Dactylosporangium siamense]|uniref:Right handed beta helix domain-containing protein n=1 Tax=Dactylosporangium siamense TaxID=685454 RepID=A0A919Q217_9ACTN|nr:hypothetical protein [Dactylosporangium siamense]GIG52958.1 hypothetical protein Dsi01nite_109990 [Dactylosporangium siamense]
MNRVRLLLAGVVATAAGLAPVQPTSAATAATFYASPAGAGSACTQAAPCSLTGAQGAVRAKLAADPGADVQVLLADGTYRLSSPWKFTAADSGSAGHPVVWRAAPGAAPVISGATRVTGWTQEGTSGVWSAPVPAGSQTRQVYVDGKKVPVAGAALSDLGWTGSWTGSSSGYNINTDANAKAWFGARTAAEVARVEFDYPGGNGPWTESRCPVASYTASTATLTMAQPCWTNVTNRAAFSQGSGGLPSMSVNTKPARIDNARALLSPGEWLLDGNRLYYQPESWQQMQNLAVELPRLESLLQGAGTLANPLHDVTFTGLQFSYATWNDPSRGFSDVQSNLRITEGRNQGMCNFANPAGSCPWGALTQPLANVAFTATTNLTLAGNRFVNLGGAGLSVMYGARNTLIQGNEFTDIASTALLLGCTYDPTPTNAGEAQGIKDHCTPDPAAVSGDSVGLNEILTNTTVSDNVIHHIGTDYSSACGITLLFSRGTKITNNVLYDLPYTAITAGVIQGHVDQASTPQNSTNINESNTISNNLFHDYMSVRSDGGAIYVEGHQAGYVNKSDGTIDPVATLAKGLQVKGNVAFNGRNTNFTYYDDAGAEWINWEGNVAFSAGGSAQGGCSPTGHFWIRNNYFSAGTQSYPCAQPVDSNASGNVSIPATPGPTSIPTSILAAAGLTSAYVAQPNAGAPQVRYISPTNASQVLIGGHGFTSTTPVYVKNVRVTNVQFVSGGFLIVPIPSGTTTADIRVGDGNGGPVTPGRIDNTDSRILYSGFSQQSGRTYGDLNGDVHFASANGSTATLTFTGTGISVYGEQNTDQGNLGISIDGGTQVTVNTVPSDGVRHANVAVYTRTGLSAGTHTIVVTKLSGNYAVLDGFAVLNTGPTTTRMDNTDSRIAYSGFTLQSGRTFGDLNGDIHYATTNGSTATLTFTGTGITVYGEQNTDQGNLGITIDGGTQVTVNTVPTDGVRHANVVVYTRTGLTAGTHTIVVTKLSGTYAVLDGFAVTSA